MDGPWSRHAELCAALALMDAGNFQGAGRRLAALLARFPNDARALALASVCKLEQDDKRGALEQARAAVSANPDDEWARRALARALLRNEKYDEADEITESLAKDDPDDPNLLLSLAISKTARQAYYEANALLDQAQDRARTQGSVSGLLNMAHMRLQQWRYTDAEEMARQALAIDPGQARIFSILAECALARKAVEEAYELALEALRLDPSDKATMRLLARTRTRRQILLRPFIPATDWILEMGREGLIVFPLLVLAPVTMVLSGFVLNDIERASRNLPSAAILSFIVGGLLAYGIVSYGVAVFARVQIARDLRRIALPNF